MYAIFEETRSGTFQRARNIALPQPGIIQKQNKMKHSKTGHDADRLEQKLSF